MCHVKYYIIGLICGEYFVKYRERNYSIYRSFYTIRCTLVSGWRDIIYIRITLSAVILHVMAILSYDSIPSQPFWTYRPRCGLLGDRHVTLLYFPNVHTACKETIWSRQIRVYQSLLDNTRMVTGAIWCRTGIQLSYRYVWTYVLLSASIFCIKCSCWKVKSWLQLWPYIHDIYTYNIFKLYNCNIYNTCIPEHLYVALVSYSVIYSAWLPIDS